MTGRSLILFFSLLVLLTPPGRSPASPLPAGEGWFVILKGGERVGTLHTTLSPDGDGWRLTAEGGVRMTVLGFRRDAASREEYILAPDLTIRSFSIGQTISGERSRLTGKLEGKSYEVTATSADGSRRWTIPVAPPLYPAPLLNTIAHLKGTFRGSTVLTFLDPESGRAKRVEFTFVGNESSGGRTLSSYRNDLYPVVENRVWVDQQGRTVRESVKRGLIETVSATADDVRQVRERLRQPLP